MVQHDEVMSALRGIRSREGVAKFIEVLLLDLEENGHEWENTDLPSFLRGLGRVLHGHPGAMEFQAPNDFDWRSLANLLLAAAHYE